RVDFSYDDFGRISKMVVRNSMSDEDRVSYWNLTYDKDGRLQRLDERLGWMKGIQQVVKVRFWYKEIRTYDSDGRIVKRQSWDKENNPIVTKYSYDSHSNLTLKETCYTYGCERTRYDGYK